jgi:ABC-type transport system involved in multi-copper enzyme maturation permease subunit
MTTHLLTSFETARLSAWNAVKISARDHTVVLLATLFFVMVLISAYLGWSATQTVNAIYGKTVTVLLAQGKLVPQNPVGDTPVLSLFRNMVTYVALLGTLAGLVLGYQAVAADRKAGVVPLLLTRPVARSSIALGKIVGIIVMIAAVLSVAALVNSLTMLLLPGLSLNSAVWLGLAKFYAVSGLYMLSFGLLGAICATRFKTESMALLIPVTIWLALTFIVPQITANIGPMAALNPQSANLVAPTATFFTFTSAVLGPISIAESYRHLASGILEITSGAGSSTTTVGALAVLLIIPNLLAGLFLIAFNRLDACRSDYND